MSIILNILYLLMALTIIGIPLATFLMDKKDQLLGLFISPILGLTIYSSANLFFITFFSTPFNPLYFFYIYLPIFILFICINLRSLEHIWKPSTNWIFFIIPVIGLLILTFLTDEILFISAGQDEIQYVNNALFMINHQNTHDLLDTLTPRIDHWLTDAVTTTLTYNHGYRRGAELILGLVIKLIGQNAYICFSYACLLAYTIYLISIPPILKHCFQITLKTAILFQLFIATSWIWIMLTFQGSLANALSLSVIAAPLISNPKIINLDSVRKSIFSGLLISGPIIFYSEAALVLTLIPFFTIFAFNYLKSKKISLINIAVLLLTILVISNIGIYSLLKNSYIAIANSSALSVINFNAFEISSLINIWSPIFGLYSLYSLASSNQYITNFVTSHTVYILLLITLVYGFAIYGSYLSTKKNLAGISFAVCLLILLLIISSSILHGNFLIASRGSQYTFQISAIGIFLLLDFAKLRIVKYLSMGLISTLLILNFNSMLSTYFYFKFTQSNSDYFITRYSPNFKNWANLIRRIQSTPEGPVLIAGYLGTAKPHFISSIIEPRGSIISTDIQKFWDLYSIPLLQQYKNFTPTDLLTLDPKSQKGDPIIKSNVATLASSTNIAIVDESASDPIDWPESKRLISRYRWRYSPIGDVIEKDIFSDIKLKSGEEILSDEHINRAILKQGEYMTLSHSCNNNCDSLFYELVFSTNIDATSFNIPLTSSEYKVLKNKLLIRWNNASSSIKIEPLKDVMLLKLYLVYGPIH